MSSTPPTDPMRRLPLWILTLLASSGLTACGGGSSASGAAQNPTLAIGAPSARTFSGSMGGPFPAGSVTYTLQNPTTEDVDWSVRCDPPWAAAQVPSGTLAAGASTPIAITLDATVARVLPDGRFESTVSFVDTGTGRVETSDEVSLVVAPESSLWSRQGPQRVAAIVVNFLDSPEPLQAEPLRTNLFTGPLSANAWFQEVSYGAISLVGSLDPTGDVFVTSLPVNASPCTYQAWGEMARARAAQDGFDAGNYDFVFYVFAGGCTSRGRPMWTPPSAWMNNAGLRALCHEGGHAMGWAHATSYACTLGGSGTTISSTCVVDEYGDPFDMMGDADTYHASHHKRAQMGWLPAANTHTIIADGAYTLTPVENVTGQVQALRIPRVVGPTGVEQFLYLETRQPGGLFETFAPGDPVATGVTLRLAGRHNAPGRSYLLDAHPQTATLEDAPLQPGETFVDPDTGSVLFVASVGPGGASVDVTLGTPLLCQPAAPTGSFTPGTIVLAAGASRALTLTLRNNDVDCAVSAFRGTYVVPAGWEDPELLGFDVTLLAGAQSVIDDDVLVVPAGTAAGSYTVTANVVNLTSGLGTSFDLTVTVP